MDIWNGIWKFAPLIVPFAGVLKSWRNQWKGPKGLYAWIEDQGHIRYANWRWAQRCGYLERQLAERDRQLDELIAGIEAQGELTRRFADSSRNVSTPSSLPASNPTPPETTMSPPKSKTPSGNLSSTPEL